MTGSPRRVPRLLGLGAACLSSGIVTVTGCMDDEGEQACQGATLTSRVSLDGEPAGTVTLVAGALEQPPAPVGGLTTGTRAAVRWSTSTAAAPGWVLERTVTSRPSAPVTTQERPSA